MNIFDETELDKKLVEEEAKFGLPQEELEEEVEEKPIEEELEVPEEAEELEEPEEIEEDEERPKDKEGAKWKKLREEKKAAKLEAAEKERQLTELRERLARLEGREEARAKPEIKEIDNDPEPDPDLDPDLHIKWELRQTRKEMEAIKKQAEYAEAVAKNEGTRRGLEMVERDYVKSNNLDDYEQAINHIKTVNKNLIKLEYPTATDAQIDAHLEAERIKKASESYSKGVNPAEYFYKMAQTLGYQKEKPVKTINTKPNIDSLNRNMGKNANLMGASNADTTGGVPTDKVVRMSIDKLLKSEGTAALEAAIAREEAKWLGM